jgi:hypothetical protein
VLPYPSSETAFALLTNATSVPAEGDGRRNWIGLQYLGISAVASKVEIQVTGDLPIHYPQGNFTSLHHDAVLEPDEIDTARVWIDPQRIEPGTYDLEVATSYTIDGVGRTMRRTLTVTVI